MLHILFNQLLLLKFWLLPNVFFCIECLYKHYCSKSIWCSIELFPWSINFHELNYLSKTWTYGSQGFHQFRTISALNEGTHFLKVLPDWSLSSKVTAFWVRGSAFLLPLGYWFHSSEVLPSPLPTHRPVEVLVHSRSWWKSSVSKKPMVYLAWFLSSLYFDFSHTLISLDWVCLQVARQLCAME